MAVRSIFQNGGGIGSKKEQNLVQDLQDESIQIMGSDVFYIPRQAANIDKLFGEDNLSYFNTFSIIEMYLETFSRYGDSNDMLSRYSAHSELMGKFGIENKEEAVFRVSRRRWEEVIGSIGTTQIDNRPNEGDLIYYPITNKLFEIKFVDHTKPFYELNEFYTYRLECTLFQYSSERFSTGAEEVDSIVPYSLDDKLYASFLTASQDVLLDASPAQLATKGIVAPIDKNSINKDVNTIAAAQKSAASALLPAFDVNNPFGSI